VKSSRKTWDAVFSTFGPYAVANILMLLAIVVFIVFQPDLSGPTDTWTLKTLLSCVAIGTIMLVAGGFILKGVLGLRKVNQSAREDRRRVEAGLPLDPEDQ
jgi:hypothetical protein